MNECKYCGAILYYPPTCCEDAIADYENEFFPNEVEDYDLGGEGG